MTPLPPRSRPPRRSRRSGARGLTLVEMMVAMVIGMLLVVGMSTVFVNSTQSRNEVELSADVIENGQYALLTLSRELAQTGFYGTMVAPAGSTIELCSTDTAVWATSLTAHAVGLNNGDADPPVPGAQARHRCRLRPARQHLHDRRGRRRLRRGRAPGLPPGLGVQHGVQHRSVCVARGNDPALALQTKACDGTRAPKRRLVRRFYYVSAADVLSSVDITPDGALPPVALVDNIEQMQIEYAVDVDGDGTPDAFSATPADWTLVIGARLWLLARSTSTSRNASAAMTFEMSDTRFDVAETPRNFKRRVYTTYIAFLTPKSRRES